MDTVVDLNGDCEFCQTFGGEMEDDSGRVDDYGFDLGALTVHGIKGVEFAKLVASAVNHLMLNGHRFEFVQTHDIDLPTELRVVTPNVWCEPRGK